MKRQENKTKPTRQTKVTYAKDVLTELQEQLSSIGKSIEKIANPIGIWGVKSNKEKLGFKFSKQEIKEMPDYIKKVFIVNNYIVSYRITNNGYYEARVRRKSMHIEASGRDFETMRSRFMDKLRNYYNVGYFPVINGNMVNCYPPQGYFNIQPYQNQKMGYEPIRNMKVDPTIQSKMMMFNDYGESWLKIKEQTTKESTYKEYVRTFNADVKPFMKNKRLFEVTRDELQNYLFGIVKSGKHRKAEKIALMLKCIFDMAKDDFDIPSPMKNVVLPSFQVKSGQALSRDEQEVLLKYCKSNPQIEGTHALLVMLLFGLRRSELKSIELVDGKWLQCETSKERMGKNVVLRKIPITAKAERYMPYIDIERAKNTNLNTIQTRIKKLFPNHHPHELRHTFVSNCKESGVNPEVVSLWAGHSLSGTITTTVYTHYSDEFQLNEAKKVI